jgi:dolichyl-phosphate-mannose--protein O-mannosyl transferase
LLCFLISAVVIDFVLQSVCKIVSKSLKSTVFHVVYGSVIGIVVYSFYLFSPLSYGFSGETANELNQISTSAINQTQSSLIALKWLESWEF